MILFKCRCGKAIKAPDNASGTIGKCPSCGESIRVPGFTGKAVRYNCPNCHTGLESPSSLIGKMDKCPSCKQSCIVPDPKRRRLFIMASCVAGGLVLLIVLALILMRGTGKPPRVPESQLPVAEENLSKSGSAAPKSTSALPTAQEKPTKPGPVGPTQAREEAPRESQIPPSELFARSSPAVVRVVSIGPDGTPIGQGSGFFASPDGKVVTNYHVIENAAAVVVYLENNAQYPLEGVLGVSRDEDVAILKVMANNVPHLRLLSGNPPPVGSSVNAIGSPQGLTNSFSSGQVSGHRKISEGVSVIQCTAPISPGSSWGPLLDNAGQVVGITTAYLAGGQNLNFAVPSNRIQHLLNMPLKLQSLDDALGRPKIPGLGTQAADPPRWALDLPYEARIRFVIAADEKIRPTLQGYFLRELRKINSVVITDEKPRWEVSVVALPQEVSGRVVGYWMSIVVFQINENFNPANPMLTTTQGQIVKHYLMMRGELVLEEGVKEMVVGIEGEIVEKDRQAYESLREYVRKAKEKQKGTK